MKTDAPSMTTETAMQTKGAPEQAIMATSPPRIMEWPQLAFALPTTFAPPARVLLTDLSMTRVFSAETTIYQGHHVVVIPPALLLPLATLPLVQQCICLQLYEATSGPPDPSRSLPDCPELECVNLCFPEYLSNKIRLVATLDITAGACARDNKSPVNKKPGTKSMTESCGQHETTSATLGSWKRRLTLTLQAVDEPQMHRTRGRARRVREHLPVNAVLAHADHALDGCSLDDLSSCAATLWQIQVRLVNGLILECLWPQSEPRCTLLTLSQNVCLKDLRNAKLSIDVHKAPSHTQADGNAQPSVKETTNRNAEILPMGSKDRCYYREFFNVGIYFQQVQAMCTSVQPVALPTVDPMLRCTVTVRVADALRGHLTHALETDWPIMNFTESTRADDASIHTLPCHPHRYKWCVVQTSTETRGLALRRCAPYNDAFALVYVEMRVPGSDMRFMALWQTNQMLTLPQYISSGKRGLGFSNMVERLELTFTYRIDLESVKASVRNFIAPSVCAELVASFRRPLAVWASVQQRSRKRSLWENTSNADMNSRIYPVRLMVGLAVMPCSAGRDETFYAITLRLLPREPGVVRDNEAAHLVQERRHDVKLVVTAHTPEMLALRRRWPAALTQLWLPRRGMSEERVVDFLQMVLSHDATTRGFCPSVHHGLLLHIETPWSSLTPTPPE